jgi:hypothetical protein
VKHPQKEFVILSAGKDLLFHGAEESRSFAALRMTVHKRVDIAVEMNSFTLQSAL